MLSGIATVLILASFAVPLMPLVTAMEGEGGHAPDNIATYSLALLFYWVRFSVVTFFNTARVEMAPRRFNGEDATAGGGLRRATAVLPAILVYSAIAATPAWASCQVQWWPW